ncbi:MAG: phytoene/squalene synthase family protein [Bacteroidota bacterium]|nr:phytoene/squalene synthase family protein [Bacteroidota bacterium]MDP4196276.1 phytoene/squalene synthase family protein [Bacteroidota bacterium]
MDLYLDTSYKISRLITKQYSTSFSLGIMAFAKKYREPVYSIYGFVRLADEIVDTFHGFDKASLLKGLREETYRAINMGISVNPVIHSFQMTVKIYNIDISYIDAFLNSMAMDLNNTSYERNVYDKYIYGSAQAVGLMCLHIFCDGDKSMFEKLKEPARMLGAAFQKVNFLRDIKSDIEERGRIYLPDIHQFDVIDINSKKFLESEVEKEFEAALQGIRKLPKGVKLGVYSAYLYYYYLFRKIKGLDLTELLSKRVSIPNIMKLVLLLKAIIIVRILR